MYSELMGNDFMRLEMREFWDGMAFIGLGKEGCFPLLTFCSCVWMNQMEQLSNWFYHIFLFLFFFLIDVIV